MHDASTYAASIVKAIIYSVFKGNDDIILGYDFLEHNTLGIYMASVYKAIALYGRTFKVAYNICKSARCKHWRCLR